VFVLTVTYPGSARVCETRRAQLSFDDGFGQLISFTTAAIDKNSRVARTVRQANANSYCVGLSAAT